MRMPSMAIEPDLAGAVTGQKAQAPLVVLVGPTAVGKTEASLLLAQRCNAEIVSADSRLFYRGMEIGTAKPTQEERRRVPHYLIDVADPDEIWSLALFQSEAQRIIADIHSRGRLPILVGGTGQYMRAVTQGWQPPAVQPHPRLRQELEQWANEIGSQGLHQRLARLDPTAAQAIDHRNLRRSVRALEVILTTGKPFSQQRGSGETQYDLLILGLQRERAELYQRIDARIQQMLASGLVDEVQVLLAAGYDPQLPSLSAIGYREIIAHLQGKYSLEQAVLEIQRATRNFVRRQANWFKPGDPAIHWFTFHSGVVDELEQAVKDHFSR